MALEAWREEGPERPALLRYALLEVAAYGAPDDLAPVLEDLVVRYGSSDLGTRTEAVRLLAETSPERALELLEPLVLEERPSATRPDQATMLRGWLAASERMNVSRPRVAATVATSLFQPPEARYEAIDALGDMGGPIATAALEEVLVEASSDGFVRRKAAQSLARYLPEEELCGVLERVASHESDPYFINFLADLIDEHCSG
jgi:HEAT repeat protein